MSNEVTSRKTPYATSPYTVQAARYPAVKSAVGRRRASRATRRTAGAAEGSIIAAVIVTQIPRYQPIPPRSVPGPASMPRIRSTVTAQAATAAATSRTVVRLPTAVMGLASRFT